MNTWIPRNLRDDGMISMNEAPSYASFVQQYVLLADHEQALAENVALYAKQSGEVLERLTDDFIFRLAEKDHAYQQLMEKAIRFAETVVKIHDFCGVESSDIESSMFLNSPEVQAWKELT